MYELYWLYTSKWEKRNRVVVIEDGKNDPTVEERRGGSMPKERRRGEWSCGYD